MEHTFKNDEMCALLKLLGKWIQVNLSFSAALNPASIDQAPRGNTIDQPCARLGMKLSKTPLCEERGVCGRWLTAGLVKMKIVVCQSTMFIWIRLKHVYTRMRARARTHGREQDWDSYILLFVCVGGVKEEKVVTAICSTSKDQSYH